MPMDNRERKFNVGDRVFAIAAWDENSEIIGVAGTVRKIERDVYGVEYDEHVDGHNLNGACRYGYGWFTGERSLDFERNPVLLAPSMTYDEVMI